MGTPTIEYRTVDKSGWPRGPWDAEPDKRQWQDEATGLPCLIVRGPGGALCGYVGVSPGHPAHGLDYYQNPYDDNFNDIALAPVQEAINNVSAHGGLTFASGCGHGDNPSRGICHVPGDGDPDHVWWFGFDCGHHGDLIPRYEWSFDGQYRDQAYVERWVRKLATQLHAIAGMPSPLDAKEGGR